MTAIRFYFKGERAGALFQRSVYRQADAVRASVRGAAIDAASEIEARGSADIAAGGNFGVRWTTGLHADVSEGGGHIRIGVRHDVPYFPVFEYGAIIHGKPLLWIPLSFATDAQGKRARDYPGALFRVDRAAGKAPLLLSADDKQPKYFGKESVNIPSKFHIREIVRSVAGELRAMYNARIRGKH